MKQSRGEADTGKCSRAAVPIQPLLAGVGAAPEPLQAVPEALSPLQRPRLPAVPAQSPEGWPGVLSTEFLTHLCQQLKFGAGALLAKVGSDLQLSVLRGARVSLSLPGLTQPWCQPCPQER